MNDKIEFDLSITYDSDYEVIANGKLINKQINKSTATWHYDMQKPMSSYLVALAIGKYSKKIEMSKNGIKATKEEFNWGFEEEKLLKMYRELINE